jgi:hypothetical protein
LHATLRTPNAPISSRDAISIVDLLNDTEMSSRSGAAGSKVSLFANIMSRRTVEEEIMKLAELEVTMEETTMGNRNTELGYEHANAKVEKYENMLSTAEKVSLTGQQNYTYLPCLFL